MAPTEERSRAVFLDRDGVINRALVRNGRPYAPRALEEFELLPGVVEAAEALREERFRLIVVTNQPDVGAGRQEREVVEAIHASLRRQLPLDAVKVCYHVNADRCACRKPRPGMLLDAAREWDLALSESFIVGDRWCDIAAGRAAGCRAILVRSDYAERQADQPDAIVASLLEASRLILSGHVSSPGTR